MTRNGGEPGDRIGHPALPARALNAGVQARALDEREGQMVKMFL